MTFIHAWPITGVVTYVAVTLLPGWRRRIRIALSLVAHVVIGVAIA